MTANPIDLVGGMTTSGNVPKADITAWAKARVEQVLADATEIRNTVLSGQLVVQLKSNGVRYIQDATDTTTADDGVNCIVSLDGKRFKPVSSVPAPTTGSLGGVFSSVAVTHQYVTGLDTSGNLTRAQPSAADLSDGNSGTGAVIHAAGAALTGLTGLAIRSGAAFDLTFATAEVLTAGRTLSWVLGDAARTITLGGNITTTGAFSTSGAFAQTLTATGSTNVTLPTTGTLATLAGAEAFTNKTYNGNTFTAGTGVLTLAAGKTLAANNTITLAGTDATTMTFPTTSATLARTDAANTFTGHQTIEGVTSTGATGTGKFVFDTAPVLGAITITSVNKLAITAPTTSATLTIPDGVTLTGPAASGTAMTLGNVETVTGAKTFNDAKLILAGITSGTTTLKSGAIAGSSVLTLPIATDTLVGRATTDTLTNKTFDTAGTGNSFSINGVAATANTGTGAIARAAGPTFTTPALGAATATTINGNTLTTGTYTLTGVAGKTLTFNNSLTLAGTDATTMTFPTTSATLARTDAANTFTGHQTIEGVTSTGATGTGKFVFDTASTLSAPVITGTMDVQQALTYSGDITPTQIVATTNDYAPTGFSTSTVVRISTDASRDITGLAGGVDGRTIYILNVGSFAAVLKDEGAGSIAANRFGFGADLTLASKQGCALLYDSTASRWRQVGGPSASGGGSGTVTSVVGGTGLDGGTITTSGTLSLSAARRTLPTVQTFTSGSSATYTTPANVLWIEVYAVASGAGGGGANNGTTTTAGNNGNTTTFNSINAAGGTAPTGTTTQPGGAGGTGGTGAATRRMPGFPGGGGINSTVLGLPSGFGGGTALMGGGATAVYNGGATVSGNAGRTNTGGGGSGGFNAAGGAANGGGGGGGGESFYLIINSPSATYTYTVAAGGAASTGTNPGGAGADGYIQVIEHYGT